MKREEISLGRAILLVCIVGFIIPISVSLITFIWAGRPMNELGKFVVLALLGGSIFSATYGIYVVHKHYRIR